MKKDGRSKPEDCKKEAPIRMVRQALVEAHTTFGQQPRVEKIAVNRNRDVRFPIQRDVAQRIVRVHSHAELRLRRRLSDVAGAPVTVLAVAERRPDGSAEAFQLDFDLVGENHVVRIQELDVSSARGGDSAVPGGAEAPTALVDVHDPRVARRPAPHYLGRRISRAVVDNHRLPIRARLRDQALQRVVKESPLIEARNDDAHQRRCRGRVLARMD